MAKATTLITPAGYTLPTSSPEGLLQFLVGIQANESGFDYMRAQGSPGGSDQPPSTSVGGGYGAYQFQEGTDQYAEAAAANWDPVAQDRIAAALATGYYHAFSGLAQQNGVDPWEYVAEAWYGPGTVPQNPIAANSQQDVANVLDAEGGHANLPQSWVYGTGYSGLSSTQVRQELGGQAVELTGSSGGGSTSSSGSSSSGGGGSFWGTVGNVLVDLAEAGSGGALGAALSLPEAITTVAGVLADVQKQLGNLYKILAWLTDPIDWLRIVCGLLGFLAAAGGVFALSGVA